ncbi:hypothetical protein GCM10022626_08950 [[Pseudomonas] carboxydohydrogena]
MCSAPKTVNRHRKFKPKMIPVPVFWSMDEAAEQRRSFDEWIKLDPTPVVQDPYNVEEVKAALGQTLLGDVVAPGTVEAMCADGRGHELLPPRRRYIRRVLDKFEGPCIEIEPTIEELEAIEDKNELALILIALNVRSNGVERVETLIKSTADAGWFGAIVQGNLQLWVGGVKRYPNWYKGPPARRPKVEDPCNLWEAFGISLWDVTILSKNGDIYEVTF